MKHKLCRYCAECHECDTACDEALEAISADAGDTIKPREYQCKGMSYISPKEMKERKNGTYKYDKS